MLEKEQSMKNEHDIGPRLAVDENLVRVLAAPDCRWTLPNERDALAQFWIFGNLTDVVFRCGDGLATSLYSPIALETSVRKKGF